MIRIRNTIWGLRRLTKKSDGRGSRTQYTYIGITMLHLRMSELYCTTPGELNDMVRIYNEAHGADNEVSD